MPIPPRRGGDVTRLASAALMPLSEAVARLTEGVAPVTERVLPVGAALGRVAARDVIGPRDHPERATALRDGWAMAADGVTGASAYSPILAHPPPAWVEAGQGLPEGTDTVLPPEALEGRMVVADAPVGDGVRRAGEDLPAGTRLIAAGERIAPRHLLTGTGGEIAVRVPRLALIVTGNATPSATALAALIAAEGCDPGRLVPVAEDADTIATAIRSARADAILVLGGTGPGRTDHSVAALALAGEVLAHGIAIHPGETAAIGRAQGRPALLLPGRPEAALAVFLALLRPLLAALSGARAAEPPTGALLRKVSATIGVSDVVFVRRRAEGFEPLGSADLPLWRLAEADGAILVPPDREGYPEGTVRPILPFFGGLPL